jgi:hypothetical protein
MTVWGGNTVLVFMVEEVISPSGYSEEKKKRERPL